jgi:hypothetical protein
VAPGIGGTVRAFAGAGVAPGVDVADIDEAFEGRSVVLDGLASREFPHALASMQVRTERVRTRVMDPAC